MPWTGDLLAGLGQYLDDQGVATWKASGAYASTDSTPVIITAVPASPDSVVVLTAYHVDADPELNDVTQGVQVRTRGPRDPRVVEALNDDVFDVLHGLSGVVLNGVHIVQVRRESHAYLGVDGNGRHEHSANYYVMAARPSTHRTD